jgi:hypothetical protein
MTERDACREARRTLALGRGARAEAHLEICPACRRVAAELSPLLESLAATATLEPPEAADLRIRARIARPPTRRPAAPRPLPVLLTAAVSLLLLGIALAGALGETELGGDGPLVAVVLVTAYLGLAATALLPLLLQRNILRALVALRVSP